METTNQPVQAAKPVISGKLPGTWSLLKRSWAIFTQRVGVLLLVLVFGAVLSVAPAGAIGGLGLLIDLVFQNTTKLITIICILVSVPVCMYFFFLLQMALITAVSNRETGVKEAFALARAKVAPFIWVTTLMCFILMGGYLLFIIPGLILTVTLFFAVFVIVTENMTGMNALLRSRQYVKGHLFGVFIRLFDMWLISLIPNIVQKYLPVPLLGFVLSILLIPFSWIYYFQLFEDLKVLKGGEPFMPSGKTFMLAAAIFGFLLLPAGTLIVVKSGLAAKAIPLLMDKYAPKQLKDGTVVTEEMKKQAEKALTGIVSGKSPAEVQKEIEKAVQTAVAAEAGQKTTEAKPAVITQPAPETEAVKKEGKKPEPGKTSVPAAVRKPAAAETAEQTVQAAEPVRGQSCFYGKVVKSDNKPLAKAIVKIIRNNSIVEKLYTGQNGGFKTGSLVPGVYTVKVWKSGYETLLKKREIKQDKELEVNFVINKLQL